ncbi:MAG TPA: phenylalanine--tRNA ligase subunit beta [Microbacteriaceae bacterium]|nr:phenylalanine--tRNA ligase subunit beta [Microbacteriaceae bacterium]
MKVSLGWLGEFVELPKDITPEQLHEDLVRVGFEEESIRSFDVTGPIVVGEVISREAEEHSNGKTINWCQVRVAPEGQQAADGEGDVRGIVCGAHNFEAGDKVVVTLPGAVLPGDFKIAARKTYGHVSDGMIASQLELGLGDDHDGIIVLSRMGLDPEIGADAIELLGLDDRAVEINVTPDRGYAFSLRGVAREISHSTGAKFTDPALTVDIAPASGFEVKLQDDAPIHGKPGCTGFITRLVRGVNPEAPTPAWMVSRLQLAGIRSLGLSIDISNYVMLELGNPLHAYDFKKLQGGITVRRARAGETLTTLDGQKRTLNTEDLLITDESGPIGLAGVMGGESTKTDETTTDILIEAAFFDPVSIARTARRHKLPSEASKRYERGVDPLVGRAAAQRMVDLLVEHGGGTADPIGSDLVATYEAPQIELAVGAAEALVGVAYTAEEVRTSLEMIGCEVAGSAETGFIVTPPSWRSDLTRREDLIEEIARIQGYDRIPAVLPTAPSGRGLTREQTLRRRTADWVCAAGYTEVQNYPFVSRAENNLFGAPKRENGADLEAVKLANPLDGEATFMRRSLLPGLIHAAHRNVSRGSNDLALLEIGSVFHPHQNLGTSFVPPIGVKPSPETLRELNDSIPEQPLMVAALLLGRATPKQPGIAERHVDWADAIDAAKLVAHAVDAEIYVRQGSHQAFHPGRTAEIFVKSETGSIAVGFAGELLPEVSAEMHLPGRVSAVEIDLGLLMHHAPREPQAASLSTYPAATQDVTLLVDAKIPAHEVMTAVKEGSGELLENISLVDDYRGKGIDEGQKALTFAMLFRSADRTLKAEEASEAKMAGVRLAESNLGARMRD